MKFRIKKFLPSNISISRHAYYAISFLLILVIIIVTGAYLYKFVYRSILYTETNIKLQQVVSKESLNMDNFDKILKNIKEKTEASRLTKISQINNFFLEVKEIKATTTPPIEGGKQIE